MVNPGLVLCLLVIAATVSGQDRDDASSFTITNINRGGSRGSNRNNGNSDDSGSFGSSSGRLTGRGRGSSGSSAAFPDYFRIEVELIRLQNDQGILANGKKCDFTRTCDPRLTAYLDTTTPLSPWPGGVPTKRWPVIFQATNNNSPTIGKVLNTDVCGGSVNKVNARIQAFDEDSLSANDDMNTFECIFNLRPRDIALDANSARFTQPLQCRAASQPDKIMLFARQRAYQIPSTSCRAVG